MIKDIREKLKKGLFRYTAPSSRACAGYEVAGLCPDFFRGQDFGLLLSDYKKYFKRYLKK